MTSLFSHTRCPGGNGRRPYTWPLKESAIFALSFAMTGNLPASPSSGIERGEHIEVELISEISTVATGDPFRIALRLVPDPGWHTYWRNPGDSGLETRIRWTLPEGVTAGEILWPIPQHLPVTGIVNYGMEGETFLLTEILPAALQPGEPLQIVADVSWLVCEVECIPGSAELEITLPTGPQTEPALEYRQAFAAALARLPKASPPDWQIGFEADADRLRLTVLTGSEPLPTDANIRFFPIRTDLVDHSAAQDLRWLPGGIQITQSLSPLFRTEPEATKGVLVVQRADTILGYHLHATRGVPVPAEPTEATIHPGDPRSTRAQERPEPATPAQATEPTDAGETQWEPFNDARLAELRRSGRAVFVNMTADWCVTCLANERRALDTPEVREALRRGDVAYLKGDWTEQDPEISAYLARYRSRGVPLYVLYPPDPEAEPRRLPARLTADLVVDAIEAAISDPGEERR